MTGRAATGEWGEQARLWYARGHELAQEGRYDQASELLSRVLVLEPASDLLRDEIATLQMQAGHFFGARMTFSAMLAVGPSDHYARYGLGLAQAKLGELAAAKDDLELAIGSRCGDPSYTHALACVDQALADGYPATPVLDDEPACARYSRPDLPRTVRLLPLAPRRGRMVSHG
jgi:tetratricopeptide (TPR) repeat protein